jgi:hypothetical protein
MVENPAELVSNIFALAITALVVGTIYAAFFLGDVGIISYILSNFVGPFFLTLILIYILANIAQGGE